MAEENLNEKDEEKTQKEQAEQAAQNDTSTSSTNSEAAGDTDGKGEAGTESEGICAP